MSQEPIFHVPYKVRTKNPNTTPTLFARALTKYHDGRVLYESWDVLNWTKDRMTVSNAEFMNQYERV